MPNFRSSICPVKTNFSYSPVLMPRNPDLARLRPRDPKRIPLPDFVRAEHLPAHRAIVIDDAHGAIALVAASILLDTPVFRHAFLDGSNDFSSELNERLRFHYGIIAILRSKSIPAVYHPNT